MPFRNRFLGSVVGAEALLEVNVVPVHFARVLVRPRRKPSNVRRRKARYSRLEPQHLIFRDDRLLAYTVEPVDDRDVLLADQLVPSSVVDLDDQRVAAV